jgi:endonuclease-3
LAQRNDRPQKESFDIDLVMRRVEEAVAPYPKAALFELAASGFDSAFEQLVACIISIRTYDEVTLPVSRQLFAQARTPADISRMELEAIQHLIEPATFSERKAAQIQAIARQIVEAHDGELPCDRTLLLSFAGVGPKCANLTLAIACQQPFISVDVHEHRITNRWGYVQTTTPEKSLAALEQILPERYWIDINRLLVPFGKHLCTGQAPRCSICPVGAMCRQVGVGRHR